ncbi:MAG: EAL domain-containing protein [Proteobacteria bacterium]|nr:EAL domain-containing protein [Pseudomonadota bacterium]
MHRVLKNQIARASAEKGELDIDALLQLVSKSYSEFDRERGRQEHANQLMMAEVEEVNAARDAVLERLSQEHRKLDAALENMAHGLGMYDADERLIVANRRFGGRVSRARDLRARTYSENLQAVRHKILSFDQPLEDIPYLMASGTPAERMVELADGRTVSISFQPLIGGGWVQVERDISEQRRADEKIRYLARHDSLTGLANRAVFNEVITEELERRPNESIGLLCLDLDHFKSVNDTLGHPIGDALLKIVAQRLQRQVREGDVVARLGGDEFAVLQLGGEQPAAAERLSKAIVESLIGSYEIDGHSVQVGVSIGIAVAPVDGHDAETLMRNADIALYRAKSDGRGVFRFFEAGMDEKMQARRQLEMDLRQALLQRQFEVFYQPLVDIPTQKVNACEALLRWRHPVRGLVPPDSFIPLAEEIGLIVDIGEWVLEQACQEACGWSPDISVAVNVSPAQFGSMRLVKAVERALKKSGLSPDRLELEITESVLINDTAHTLELLHRLKGLGVRISMDDFGTGYSSLSYLRRFPFDKLKIDRSFIGDLTRDPEASAIVRAVIQLANTLGMSTTAEGVEDSDQRDLLQALNCRQFQGYLVSKPIDATALHAFLGPKTLTKDRSVA